MRKSIYLLTTTPSSHTHRFHPLPIATPASCSPHPLATHIHSTHSPQLSSILLTCAKFKVWMTIVESGWNVPVLFVITFYVLYMYTTFPILHTLYLTPQHIPHTPPYTPHPTPHTPHNHTLAPSPQGLSPQSPTSPSGQQQLTPSVAAKLIERQGVCAACTQPIR